MKEYTFENILEVDAFLKSIDILVPQRSEGRKTEHTERYSIVNYLDQFKNDIFTDFPVQLIHYDKPDFRILSKNKSIGIEVTESIPEQLARATVLLEKHFPNGGILEPEFFGWNTPDRTNDEIVEILKKSNDRLIGQPSYGKSIEKNWIQGIHECIINKTKKLNQYDFDKFMMNWLLIYDNQIKIFLDTEYVENSLYIVLDNYFGKEEKYIFDRIVILSGKYFYSIETENVSTVNIITRNVI